MTKKITQADCSELIDMGMNIIYMELKRITNLLTSGQELSNSDTRALTSYMTTLNQTDKDWRNKLKEAQEEIDSYTEEELLEVSGTKSPMSIKKILDIATKN